MPAELLTDLSPALLALITLLAAVTALVANAVKALAPDLSGPAVARLTILGVLGMGALRAVGMEELGAWSAAADYAFWILVAAMAAMLNYDASQHQATRRGARRYRAQAAQKRGTAYALDPSAPPLIDPGKLGLRPIDESEPF